MVARLIKWADRSDSRSELAAFFSMVDRRNTLHWRACQWSAAYPEVFLSGQIPYASVVEQMTVRRMPLPAFAPRDAATIAFAGIWSELQQRLQRREQEGEEKEAAPPARWQRLLETIESLIVQLESADGQDSGASRPLGLDDGATVATIAFPKTMARISAAEGADGSTNGDVNFVHRFDTDRRDLQRSGYVLELREGPGSLIVAVTRSGADHERGDPLRRAEAQIDGWWATQILSGQMSPLEALERRIGTRVPWLIETVGAAAEAQGCGGSHRLSRTRTTLVKRLRARTRTRTDSSPRRRPVRQCDSASATAASPRSPAKPSTATPLRSAAGMNAYAGR
jgi:hypothetical protein